MNQTDNLQQLRAGNETQIKRQLAEYLSQQPKSTQLIHRWMNRLEAASVGVTVAAFTAALYFSFAWKTVDPIVIPLAWFIFAASVAPGLFFSGLDTIFLRAFPTTVMPGRTRSRFITGSSAVWVGIGFILIAPVVIAFWGVMSYATLTRNFVLLQPMIGFLGLAMAVAIVAGMAQKTFSRLLR